MQLERGDNENTRKRPGQEKGWLKGRVKVWSVLEAKRRDSEIVSSIRAEVSGNLRDRKITGFCSQEYIDRL